MKILFTIIVLFANFYPAFSKTDDFTKLKSLRKDIISNPKAVEIYKTDFYPLDGTCKEYFHNSKKGFKRLIDSMVPFIQDSLLDINIYQDSIVEFDERIKELSNDNYLLGELEKKASDTHALNKDFKNQLISIKKSIDYFTLSEHKNANFYKIEMLVKLLSFYHQHGIFSYSNDILKFLKSENNLLLLDKNAREIKIQLMILECNYLITLSKIEQANVLLKEALILKDTNKFSKELSGIYYSLDEPDKAFNCLMIFFKFHNVSGIDKTFLLLKHYLIINDIKKAQTLFSNIKDIDKDYAAKIPEFQITLSKYHRINGNYKLAFEHLTNYQELHNSITKSGLDILVNGKKMELINYEIHDDKNIQFAQTLFFIVSLMLFIFITLFFYNKKVQLLSKVELDKTKEILEFKSIFFENVSHEMRTPITVIMGYLQLINENIFKPKQLGLYSNLALDNCRNLLKSFNIFLKLDEGKNSKDIISLKPINMFFKELLLSFRSQLEIKQIKIYYKSNLRDNLNIKFNYEKLQQIVSNLISNAIKYSNSRSNIYANVNLNKDEIVFSIQDEGVGIDKEEHNLIFSRFYQSKSNSSHEGFGIGLSIVQDLIKQLNGKIIVESEPNKGSLFTITLPVEKEDHSLGISLLDNNFVLLNELENQKKLKAKKLPKALIIDDNIEIIRFYQEIFKNELTAFFAFNGIEALNFLSKNNVDIIITDYRMPKMNGIDFKLKVNQIESCRSIPFIMVSAVDECNNRSLNLDVGLSDYLVKPFDKNEIITRVKVLLGNRILSEKLFFNEYEDLKFEDKYSKVIERIGDLIENNINDPKLNVAFLSKELGVNIKKLNLILQSKIGLTAIKVITEIRLLKSYDLIINNHYETVSEVMYAVGFNSRPNFYNKFYKRFGIKPGELKSKFKKI